MSPKDEIAKLREEIAEHDHLYYVDGKPTISDQEYDKLFSRLKKLEEAHPDLITPDSPTQRVGEKPLEGFAHVTHAVPMMSIDNTYNEAELREFDGRVVKGLDGQKHEYLIEPKIDGVSASLRYEDGRLVLGATRGDGRTGDDVTRNIRTIRAIPLQLRGKKHPRVIEARGEIYWPLKAFEKFNAKRTEAGEEPFANARNGTAGTLKMLDSRIVAGRGLSFISHGVGEMVGVDAETCEELYKLFLQWGIPVSTHRKVLPDIDAVIRFVEDWESHRHKLDFQTDGLVIKINRFDQRDMLGATSRFPRWCIAYKYAAEQKETKVIRIDFSVGKLGTLTPGALLEPVQLSGTTVKLVSLHNLDQVRRLDIREGDTVLVEKAGEIIPQVLRVIKEKRPSGTKEVRRPTKCPACGGEVEQDEGGVYLRCINPSCPAQLRERLIYFCARDQMDIEGVGDVLAAQFVESGLVHSFADLYTLNDRMDDFLALERMGKKSAENILAGVEASKKQPLARVFAALNIRHVGTATAELIAEHFGDMEKIAEASEEELQEVEGIGPEVAKSIRRFFASAAGSKTWRSLHDAGVNMKQPKAKRSEHQSLAGKSLVVTGTLEKFSRTEIEKLIKEHGGKVAGSVSKKTDYLVVGEDAGSKLEKAKSLGVKTLTEQEFEKLIGR